MNRQQKIVEDFLHLEVQHNLFDITDINGVRVWDIVRFHIEYSILWGYQISPTRKNNRSPKEYIHVISRLLSAARLLFSKRIYSTLSITSSRNRIEGREADQNQHDALKLIDPKQLLIIETLQTTKAYKNSYPLTVQNLYSRIHPVHAPHFDFEPLIAVIENRFGKIQQTDTSLNELLNIFYKERAFWNYFFQKHKTERLFLTQNGLMKGLLAAARECGVNVVEFQHGIVNRKHYAYSYPQGIDVETKSYQPWKMLRFSDFWFSDFYAPFPTTSVGNDYFSKPVSLTPSEPQSLLAISTNAFGEKLSDIIAEIAGTAMQWKIYYKLHPNEFDNIEYYKHKLEPYPNVCIVTNEQNTNELLGRCKAMVTMQSTVIYEALQAGRNVFMLTAENTTRWRLREYITSKTPADWNSF